MAAKKDILSMVEELIDKQSRNNELLIEVAEEMKKVTYELRKVTRGMSEVTHLLENRGRQLQDLIKKLQ
jgi:hypothetical protein